MRGAGNETGLVIRIGNPPVTSNFKICSNCKQSKEFPDNFYRDKKCRDGHKPYCKRWRAANRERTNEKPRIRTDQMRKREREYRRKYLAKRRANDPKYRAWKAQKDREYRQTPKGKARMLRNKARRKQKGGRHKITGSQWKRIMHKSGSRCVYCGTKEKLTADHFIPLAKGGSTEEHNIVIACLSCNSSKQDKMPERWCSAEQLSRVMSILQ